MSNNLDFDLNNEDDDSENLGLCERQVLERMVKEVHKTNKAINNEKAVLVLENAELKARCAFYKKVIFT